MYCICCKKNNVTPYNIIDDSLKGKLSEEELIWNKPDKLVDGGIINTISAGYGSNYDGDKFVLAICDNCIKENSEDATLLFLDNYFINDKEFINFEIEKVKKKYNRRKNLDNLI